MTPKWLDAPHRLSVRTVLAAKATSYLELFFFGRFFRLVLAKSFNCFSLIDSAICFDAPLREGLLSLSALRGKRSACGHLLFF